MTFIFIDESGQFTKHNHEEYFVIASFTAEDPRRTEKAFRAWCKTRFPRKMRNQNEIKWSATGIDDKLRLRTLKYISKLDIRIKFTYLLKCNIPNEYRNKDKLHSGLLYTNIVGEVLDMYLPITDKDLHIYCDRRRLSGVTESEFKSILESRLIPKLFKNTIIKTDMVDSASNPNIQIVDWIAGAIARYLEKGKLGKDLFAIIKGNVSNVEGKELFNNFPI